MEGITFSLNLLRVTYSDDLTDLEMTNALWHLANDLGIFESACFTFSPVETGKRAHARHMHIHWWGDHLSKNGKTDIYKKHRNDGFALLEGTNGTYYQSIDTSSVEQFCLIMRYPLKTGFNMLMPEFYEEMMACRKYYPSFFNIEEQQQLAAMQLEVKLKHEAEMAAKEEAHKRSHGNKIYALAKARHVKQPFCSIKEIVIFLLKETVKDPECITLSKSRTADLASKLALEFECITYNEFADSIMHKFF